MESDQPLITPSTHPWHPLHDPPTSQGSRFNERLLNPSAPFQGTSRYREIFQGNSLPGLFTFPTPTYVPSYPSDLTKNIPHTDMDIDMHDPLRLYPRSQEIQSPPLGILPQFLSVEQPLCPFPADKFSVSNWQQSTSLPQGGLGPHPQSHDWTDLALLNSYLHASTSSGPPPEDATGSPHRESVNESTDLAVFNSFLRPFSYSLPPGTATAGLHRGFVDESGPHVPSLPPK